MDITDNELLTLAAKTLGARPWEHRYAWTFICLSDDPDCCPFEIYPDGRHKKNWNPLVDDGDALRLAVELGICIEFGYCADDAPIVRCGEEHNREEWKEYERFPDPFKETRRAIVRAAAEIGKGVIEFPSVDDIMDNWS